MGILYAAFLRPCFFRKGRLQPRRPLFSAYDISGTALCSLLFVVSVFISSPWDASRLLLLFSLYPLCFLSAVLSFSFFYSTLSLILRILSPWDVSLPLLLFTLFSATSSVCHPSSSATPLSFCAFSLSPLTLFSMHIFQYKVCIELIVTKFSHMAYN